MTDHHEAGHMFVHMAIHHPKPEYAADLLASMHRVGAAAQGTPGLIEIDAWRDTGSDRLLGLARWESEADYQAASEAIFAVVADDPFDVWCELPPEVFHLTR
jgi:heme-degrading monooxygenase HmoA